MELEEDLVIVCFEPAPFVPGQYEGFQVLLQVQKSEAVVPYLLVGGKASEPSVTKKALSRSTCEAITHAVV